MNQYIIKSSDLPKINKEIWPWNYLEFKTIEDFLHFLHQKWLMKIEFHVEKK